MKKCHIYVDGSWLYYQCTGKKVLGKQTVYKKMFIDYKKLVDLIVRHVQTVSGEFIVPGERHYFTSIIKDIPETDNVTIDGKDYPLTVMKSMSEAKAKTVSKVKLGGFEVTCFEIGYRPWMAKAINDGTYQEKMVDAAIVAKFVANCLKREYSEDYHAILSGDLDMLAAFEEVLMVKESSIKFFLVTIDPIQWDQKDNQVSRDLAQFEYFAIESLFLDRYIPYFMQGRNVLQCQGCSLYFDAGESNIRLCSNCDAIHKSKNPFRDSKVKRIKRAKI